MLNSALNGVLIIHAVASLTRNQSQQVLMDELGFEAHWETKAGLSNLICEFAGDYGQMMRLVEALTQCPEMSFELMILTSEQQDGERWVYTSALGVGFCRIDVAGNHLLMQEQIERLIRESGDHMLKFERLINKALLKPWDESFEELREARLRQRRLPKVS